MGDSSLASAVAQVESAGFPYAMRFEMGLFEAGYGAGKPEISVIMGAHKCNMVTARTIYCTSYGLFQIMGFNLYGPLGWTNAVAPFMFDPEQQLAMFNKFCSLNGVDPQTFDWSDAAVEDFARKYNGPGNVADYSAKLKAAYANLPKGET